MLTWGAKRDEKIIGIPHTSHISSHRTIDILRRRHISARYDLAHVTIVRRTICLVSDTLRAFEHRTSQILHNSSLTQAWDLDDLHSDLSDVWDIGYHAIDSIRYLWSWLLLFETLTGLVVDFAAVAISKGVVLDWRRGTYTIAVRF